MGKKVLYIDYDRCNGCEICALHCSFTKTGTFNPDRSRVKIMGWEERGLFIPSMCMHCEEPPCIPACPEDAISKDKKTGIVNIGKKCRGRLTCIPACPYGAITIDPTNNNIIQCDLCGGDPQCVKVCPVGVIQLVDEDTIVPEQRREYLAALSAALKSVPGGLYAAGGKK